MTKIFWGGRFDEKWWCDYMEGEFEPNLQKDLQLLMKNSPVDRKRHAGLEKARNLVKDSDWVVLPEDGRYYDRLQDRIMDAVEEITAPESRESEEAMTEDAKLSWTAAVLGVISFRRWGNRGEFQRI